jgi:hypothetical protein
MSIIYTESDTYTCVHWISRECTVESSPVLPVASTYYRTVHKLEYIWV